MIPRSAVKAAAAVYVPEANGAREVLRGVFAREEFRLPWAPL